MGINVAYIVAVGERREGMGLRGHDCRCEDVAIRGSKQRGRRQRRGNERIKIEGARKVPPPKHAS
jgi:hypothetical protein